MTKPTPTKIPPRRGPLADPVVSQRVDANIQPRQATPQPIPSERLAAAAAVRTEQPAEDQATTAGEAGLPVPRRKRIHAGKRPTKLSAPERPGFHRHWFNDVPGRIQQKLEQGYTHVVDEQRRNVVRIVGETKHGTGLSAFLMEIPDEYYQEDTDDKQETLNVIDEQLYSGTFNEQPGDKRYVPTSTPISMGVKRGPG